MRANLVYMTRFDYNVKCLDTRYKFDEIADKVKTSLKFQS